MHGEMARRCKKRGRDDARRCKTRCAGHGDAQRGGTSMLNFLWKQKNISYFATQPVITVAAASAAAVFAVARPRLGSQRRLPPTAVGENVWCAGGARGRVPGPRAEAPRTSEAVVAFNG